MCAFVCCLVCCLCALCWCVFVWDVLCDDVWFVFVVVFVCVRSMCLCVVSVESCVMLYGVLSFFV